MDIKGGGGEKKDNRDSVNYELGRTIEQGPYKDKSKRVILAGINQLCKASRDEF